MLRKKRKFHIFAYTFCGYKTSSYVMSKLYETEHADKN